MQSMWSQVHKRPEGEPHHRVTPSASQSDAGLAATGTVADLTSPPASSSSRHAEATMLPKENASQTRQHEEDIATQPDRVPVQTLHCLEQCHLDCSGTVDMMRCCLCFQWYHEMCDRDVDKETPWWVCPTCRSLSPSVAALSVMITQMQDNMSKVLDINSRLVASANDLSNKNEFLAAQVALLTTALSSRTHVTPNTRPTKEVPNLLTGASTIRDIANTDPKMPLYHLPWRCQNWWHIENFERHKCRLIGRCQHSCRHKRLRHEIPSWENMW